MAIRLRRSGRPDGGPGANFAGSRQTILTHGGFDWHDNLDPDGSMTQISAATTRYDRMLDLAVVSIQAD
jgi:hypothetical protein